MITFQSGPYHRRTVDLMSSGGNLVVIDRSQPGGSFVLYSVVHGVAHYIRTSDTPFTGAYVALDKISPAEPGTPAERATQAGHYEWATKHVVRDFVNQPRMSGKQAARERFIELMAENEKAEANEPDPGLAAYLRTCAPDRYLFDEPVEVTALNEIVPATEELDSHECAENLYEVKGVEFCRVCGTTTEGGL